MKFSIQEEGHDKQIFFTFKEASAATGLPSKVILRVLQSGQNKYVRRSDKKVFWIRGEETEPFIQLMEKIFSPRKKSERPLDFPAQFSSINSRRKKLTSWILRRNLMKSLGNRPDWRNF